MTSPWTAPAVQDSIRDDGAAGVREPYRVGATLAILSTSMLFAAQAVVQASWRG